jgi:cation diffusion facilitator family transporter
MHIHTLERWKHPHRFTADDTENEVKTLRVVLLTGLMMVVEIITGWAFGSMALLADGWHMGTHAGALGIALFAYRYARRHENSPRYSFGTGKISVLGGFSSAIVLLVVAILMMVESVERFWNPQEIRFTEAIIVACVGLVVNLLSVYLLGDNHHDHEHEQNHSDHNIRAAYLHVLADTLTSILAIIALLVGRAIGWIWLDALMGVVGGVVISRWAIGLLRETSHILLDGSPDKEILEQIRGEIESDADNRITDLHVWKVNSKNIAAIVSLVTHYVRPIKHYHDLLENLPGLVHVTVEVNVCQDKPCLPADSAVAEV